MLSNEKVSAYHVLLWIKAAQFYERFIPQTKKVLFLAELKPLFLESFQGSRTQFQSKRLVMLRTDVYDTADLY